MSPYYLHTNSLRKHGISSIHSLNSTLFIQSLTLTEELLNTAKAMAKKIMSKGMVAVQLCKAAVNEGMDTDLETGAAYEAEVFGLCFATNDQKEGMAAFTGKRQANFTGN